MAGYTPLFSSLTTGTLCGKWPDIGLWPIVLSLADKEGIVDVTPAYLASVTGLPLEDVVACMRRFCSPDPYSRTSDYDGARLILIDGHREWGWRIVNHSKYRDKARKAAFDADRVRTGQNAARMAERRQDPTRPDATRRHPPSDSDANTDSNSNPDTCIERTHADFEEVKKAYPAFGGRQDWISAQHHWHCRISEGITAAKLLEGVKRYAAYVKAGGVSNQNYVMTPKKFFGDPDRPWAQPWEIAKAAVPVSTKIAPDPEWLKRMAQEEANENA